MSITGKCSEESNNVFDQEFSLKVKGGAMLQDKVNIILKDGDKVFGEARMKIGTLINAGTIVNPSSFSAFDELKLHYATDRDNWYSLFEGDAHKGQIMLETTFKSSAAWHVDSKLFKQSNKGLLGWLACGAITCAATAGGVAYAVMDS